MWEREVESECVCVCYESVVHWFSLVSFSFATGFRKSRSNIEGEDTAGQCTMPSFHETHIQTDTDTDTQTHTRRHPPLCGDCRFGTRRVGIVSERLCCTRPATILLLSMGLLQRCSSCLSASHTHTHTHTHMHAHTHMHTQILFPPAASCQASVLELSL